MNTRPPAFSTGAGAPNLGPRSIPSAEMPSDSRPPGYTSSAWLRGLLPVFVLLLLAALVVVPMLIGRHIDTLRDHRVELVFPAQHTLQESRSLLTEQLAAVRGYQISGDVSHLADLQEALSREPPVTDRLALLAEQLGPKADEPVREFQARIAEWQQGPRALLDGEITREQLVASLPLGQERFEAALEAADEARAALNRYEGQLQNRVQAAERFERVLTILLSLAALLAGLVMVWVMYRLHRVTQELEMRAEGLRVSEERFRLIAENLREMIWISDPGYTVQYYLSPAYERIWGRSGDEARRNPRSFLEAIVPEDRPRVEAALQGYARGEYAAEYRIVRSDGEIRWISGRGYPVRDEDGDIFLIAGIAEDITRQKEVEQQRERLLERETVAHARTEAALQLRDRVVSIVSHDLKNPLHTIGMAAELLEMPLLDEQRDRQIGIIRRTVARANRMVSDLLDAARLQSGRAITIERQSLEIQPLLTEAVEAFRYQAEQKNQQLTCDVPRDIPGIVGDEDRLMQALSNLIGNAVKFTPDGGHIDVEARVDPRGHVRFSVTDTGPGIDAEMLPHLFEPFAQARDTASLGTGLGLSITRGIVEAHGGDISVQSEPGTGTTFTFTLPLQRTSSGSTPTSGSEDTMADRENRRTHDQGRSVDQPAPANQSTADSGDPGATPAAEDPVYPDPVDDTLDDSFPASDPPQWWSARSL